MANQTRSSPALPLGTFAPVLAVHFLGTLGFSMAIPFLIFIVTDLGGAPWTFGLVGATYSAFQFAGAPVLGRWSDSVGRRPVLVASQVGTLLAWVLFLVALSLPRSEGLFEIAGASITLPLLLVFAARALDGATGGNISVANALVADLTADTPELRQAAFGRMGQAASLGFVIGPAVAGLLGGTAWGPRLPIALAGVFALVTTIAILLFLKEPKRHCPEGAPAPSAVESSLHQQDAPCDKAPAEVTPSILRRRPVLLALVGTFTLFLGFNVFFSSFPVYAEAGYGWSPGELGTFFAILAGAMMFAQGPGLAFVSARLSGPWVFALGVILLAAALVVFYVAEGPVVYLGAILYAVGNGISWPTFQARVAEVGGGEQGSVQGAAASASSLASIAGLVVGGILYPFFESQLFIAAAILFVVTALLTPVWFGTGSKGGEAEA